MPATLRTLDYLINETTGSLKSANNITAAQIRDAVASVYHLDHSADVSITGAATATISKWHICTGTTSDYTVTLPAVSGNAGKLIGLRMSSALTKLVTIDGNASETIDGALTRVMWANEVAILFCDGTGWTKVAGKSIPMFCSTKQAATQTLTNAIETKILLDTINSESPAGQADITTNDRINIKRTGTYVITAAATLNLAATSTNNQLYFSINGTKYTLIALIPTTGAALPGLNVSAPVSLTINDYVELGAYQESGANRDTIGGTEFLIILEQPSW